MNAVIVYLDVTPGQALDVLELIIVAASESIQAQTLAASLDTTAFLLDCMDTKYHARLAEVIERALSSLGEHVLTREVERALTTLALSLDREKLKRTSAKVREAAAELAKTVGALNSRSTRVPSKA